MLQTETVQGCSSATPSHEDPREWCRQRTDVKRCSRADTSDRSYISIVRERLGEQRVFSVVLVSEPEGLFECIFYS